MPRYVIEREMPNVGKATSADLTAVAQKSCDVLRAMGPRIQWEHSYVTDNKVYCVYIAENQELVREHAKQGGFPVDRVEEVRSIIDPVTSEG